MLVACSGDGEGGNTTSPTTIASAGTALPSPSVAPSGSSSASASPSKPVTTLNNLDPISVNGKFGQAPAVTGPWPASAAKTQVKVLQEGTGAKVSKGGTVLVDYTGINATTGKSFDSSFDQKTGKGKPVAFPLTQVVQGFRTGLEGQKIGSRVVILMTPKDGYGDRGQPQAGIGPNDSLIFVVDIISAQLEEPTGTPVTPPAGLPTVKDNGKGKAPTVTIPGGNAPDKLVIQPLIKGTGPAVKATDGIVVNYTSVGWKSGDVYAQTYGTGPEAGMLNTLIPGWQKGLVNQPVGSRVLLIVPPSEAYPKGNATPSIPAGETLVYVVDILFASPPS